MDSLEAILRSRKRKELIWVVTLCAISLALVVSVAAITAPDAEDESTTEESSVQLEEVSSEEVIEPVALEAPAPKYTEDDLFCMAAVIYNEAGGDACSDDTRRMVGYVVLNRVNDARFPDTIREVLEAKGQYGRFSVTGVKFANRSSLPQEQHAVERAYQIAKEVLECDEIPIPSTVVFQSERELGTSLYSYQDKTYFCHG